MHIIWHKFVEKVAKGKKRVSRPTEEKRPEEPVEVDGTPDVEIDDAYKQYKQLCRGLCSFHPNLGLAQTFVYLS